MILKISVADPDPSDPYVFGPPGSGYRAISQRLGGMDPYSDPSIIKQKKVRKTLIPTFCDFLKNYVYVPFKKLVFCWRLEV
jgi:hypothetical protein